MQDLTSFNPYPFTNLIDSLNCIQGSDFIHDSCSLDLFNVNPPENFESCEFNYELKEGMKMESQLWILISDFSSSFPSILSRLIQNAGRTWLHGIRVMKLLEMKDFWTPKSEREQEFLGMESWISISEFFCRGMEVLIQQPFQPWKEAIYNHRGCEICHPSLEILLCCLTPLKSTSSNFESLRNRIHLVVNEILRWTDQE